jgi:hypothetical protein
MLLIAKKILKKSNLFLSWGVGRASYNLGLALRFVMAVVRSRGLLSSPSQDFDGHAHCTAVVKRISASHTAEPQLTSYLSSSHIQCYPQTFTANFLILCASLERQSS